MPRNELVSEATQPQRTGSSLPARGTIQLLVARGCFMVSGYLISVILARGLGPAEYGVYGVIMSVLLWIEMVGSAGIPGATTKLIPQHEGQATAIAQTAKAFLLLVALVLFILCWLLTPTLTRLLHMPTGTSWFRLAILDIPFSGMYLAYQGMLHGHRRFGALSVGFIVYSCTKLGGILLLFVLGLSVSGALLVNVLATVGALVYLIAKFPPAGLLPSYGLLPVILSVALPMGLYLMALQILLSLDLWLLKSLWAGSEDVVGFYVAALNVAKLPTVVPSVLSGVLFASLSWAFAQADNILARRYIQAAGRFTFIVLFPSCVLAILHAEPIMALLYSKVYTPGGIYLSLQLVAFFLMAFLDLFFHVLMAADKHYQSAGILLALIPASVLFNVALIPKFGAIGAASSLVLTIFLGTVMAMIFAYRLFGSPMRVSTVTRVIVATALTVLISSQISLVGPWLLLRLVVLLGLYTLFLSLLKELSWEDLKPFAVWQKGLS